MYAGHSRFTMNRFRIYCGGLFFNIQYFLELDLSHWDLERKRKIYIYIHGIIVLEENRLVSFTDRNWLKCRKTSSIREKSAKKKPSDLQQR